MKMNINILLFKFISGQFVNSSFYKLKSIFKSKKVRILDEKISLHKYTDAASLVGDFSKSNEPNTLRKISVCLFYSDKFEEANSYMSKAIEKKGLTVNMLETKICEFMGNNVREISFRCKGGFGNFGFFDLITNNGEQLLAKICSKTENSRESFFNKEIYPYMSQLHKYIPKLYGDFSVGCFRIVIFENIFGVKETTTNQHCINVISELCSLNNSEMIKKIKKSPRYNGNYEAGHLHSIICQKYILSTMKNNINIANADNDLNVLVDEFKTVLLDTKLYKKGNNKSLYGFCHNDFHKNNILVDNGHPYVFDWANFGIRLKGWDLVYYLANYEESFTDIQKIIETNIFPETVDDYLLGRGLLAYMFFYVWTQRLHGKYNSELKDRCFYPAAQYAIKNFNAYMTSEVSLNDE